MLAAKKRREPKAVAPIEYGGMRYEAPIAGSLYGYQQDGGIVIARTLDDATLVWTQRIYANEDVSDVEADKQDVFITKMSLNADANALFIENEHGVEFRFNLFDRSIKRLASHA